MAFELTCAFSSLSVSNTRFIAAVIERHTHTPERRRRYWGRSGTESDHGKTNHLCPLHIHRLTEAEKFTNMMTPKTTSCVHCIMPYSASALMERGIE